MKRRHQSTEEGGPKVPAYIVTFSDMVTLLLTFFVMLLSLATVQDEEIFHKGRDSFSFAIRNLGIGMLLGRKPRPDFGNVKIRHFISSPDKLFKGRSIHIKEEKIRQVFNELRQSMKTMPSEIAAKKTDFSLTNIRFARGDARLNASAKQFLGGFCSHLQQDSGSRPVKLYVLGLADDRATEKEQWILSAKRAKAAADYLRGILSSGTSFQTQRSAFGGWSKWSVYWWGAGPGGDWVRRDSPISRQSQILIAVLRADD
ncbi:MAG: OmpA family protein [Planctomycetes bacterium]|nr:OmpA family protein [Planctomycetota bacterium]MCH8118423.1 OmpA family protein [Planctomycetota bacterium]